MDVVTGVISVSDNNVVDLSFPEERDRLYVVRDFALVIPRFANDRSFNGYAALSVALNQRTSLDGSELFAGDILARKAFTAVSFNAAGPVRINTIDMDNIPEYQVVDQVSAAFISDIRLIVSVIEPVPATDVTYAVYYERVKATRDLLDAARERMYSPVQVLGV